MQYIEILSCAFRLCSEQALSKGFNRHVRSQAPACRLSGSRSLGASKKGAHSSPFLAKAGVMNIFLQTGHVESKMLFEK